ncbi:MAG: M23 family metallopeptidase [Candidatus Komeilibacteria bacterium]|nr:M23 family metallopeptidase [Candidatus Komeilibacteria bacterium]
MNKKTALITTFFLLAFSGGFLFAFSQDNPLPTEPLEQALTSLEPIQAAVAQAEVQEIVAVPQTIFASPIDSPWERIIKKPLGIKISPANSPVQPEVFEGYHSGVDFETFPEEQEVDIAISAICDGKLRFKAWAKGYGGVAVQDCELEGEPITVIYGHLKLESIKPGFGANLNQGDFIGNLGRGFSKETDNRRKHLHLGIKRGENKDSQNNNRADIRGYVPEETDLDEWLDITDYLNTDSQNSKPLVTN